MQTHYKCSCCQTEIAVKPEITELYMMYFVIGSDIECPNCGTIGRVTGIVYYEDVKQVKHYPVI